MAENIRDTIQQLIETCKDGETGYLHAAGAADDERLQAYFQQQSAERGRFLVELAHVIDQLGVSDPDTTGSTAAVLHRAWFELKDDFGGGDHTLLESVEQGEDTAKKHYEEALATSLPPAIDTIIRRQYASIMGAHNKVRALRDGTELIEPGERDQRVA